MYRPRAFDVVDLDELHHIVADNQPAHLVTPTADGLVASVLPMLLDPAQGSSSNRLLGHLARANPHWRDASDGAESLAIFAGPDAYVSPSFYTTKQRTGEVVPTWNYVVAHVYGELVVHDDRGWVRDLVTRLTEHHEAGRDEPWSIDDAPGEFVERQLRAIVGIELVIRRIEGKRKLSQNRPVEDIDGVVRGLAAGSGSEQAVARAMRT